MLQSLTEKRVIGSFTSAQWDGRNIPEPIRTIAGLPAKWNWIGAIVVFVLANLGTFGGVILVFGVIGLLLRASMSARSRSPRQKFADDLMADINEAIVELTGNANVILSAKDLRALRKTGQQIPLPVNGVSGLDLSVVRDRPAGHRTRVTARADDAVYTTQVIVTATAPDYGTDSFDKLLNATLVSD
jgi:hypothetical protein